MSYARITHQKYELLHLYNFIQVQIPILSVINETNSIEAKMRPRNIYDINKKLITVYYEL